MIGKALGPYRVLDKVGEGGMGEVYRARDTRLDRAVAIKVLPSEVAADATSRARFEREARAIAALDHPHICGIYDVGEFGGTHFLVMPLLEGQTLAARLEKGALPLEQALKLSAEIADALDKAHRQGIIHRDLKPANIMLTKAGSKLLDFGLAKLKTPGGPISMSGMAKLATTTPGTGAGTIVGTIHYMSPEQVEGKEADARSDIWGLGTVIYEMTTGARPFAGDSAASVIGAILKDEPRLVSSRQALAPAALDQLVAGCLEKDPEARWQSAADVRRQLRWIAPAPDAARAAGLPATTRSRIGWTAAAILSLVLAGDALRSRFFQPVVAPPEAVAFSILPPAGQSLAGAPATVPAPQLALSPDGRHLIFVATEPQGRSSLWIRTLSGTEAHHLPGTADAEHPFWSIDSQSVAFFSQGVLKKIDLGRAGGPEVVAAATVDTRGGAWGGAGTIVYAPSGNVGFVKIAGPGDSGTPFEIPGSSGAVRWPSFLPDGRHFLFLTRDPDPNRKGIYIGSMEGTAPRRVVSGDFSAQYALGHLLWINGPMLMAQPFDPSALQMSGSPTVVVQPVAASSTGFGAFSLSATGVLAYSSGLLGASELRWVDRSGRALDLVAPAADYVDFQLSPDGRQLAFSRTDPQTQASDVWVRDLARGTDALLTQEPLTDAAPLWSPAGDRIVYRSNRTSGTNELFRTAPSSGAATETIFSRGDQRTAHGTTRTPSNLLSTDWSPDGQHLVYHVSTGTASYDVWALRMDDTRRAMPLAQSRNNEIQAVISPDGGWLAYASDESGRFEIYVQSFPDASRSPKSTVSSGGGVQPRWSRDGRELFYLRSDGSLMSVAVRTQVRFSPGAVTALFKTNLPVAVNPYRMDYVPSPDSRRFLMKIPVDGAAPPSITVVLNWPALLRK